MTVFRQLALRYYGTGPIEYSHSLSEQIGGQLAVGFTLTHRVEARITPAPRHRTCPGYFATRAVKAYNPASAAGR